MIPNCKFVVNNLCTVIVFHAMHCKYSWNIVYFVCILFLSLQIKLVTLWRIRIIKIM